MSVFVLKKLKVGIYIISAVHCLGPDSISFFVGIVDVLNARMFSLNNWIHSTYAKAYQCLAGHLNKIKSFAESIS